MLFVLSIQPVIYIKYYDLPTVYLGSRNHNFYYASIFVLRYEMYFTHSLPWLVHAC